MLSPRIVFVVGHSNWGKSETLRALTSGSYRQRRITINSLELFIRRSSNDDDPETFIKLMKSIDPVRWPYVIAALCPNFDVKARKTQLVLELLQSKGYKFFFWVIKHKYGTDTAIASEEIARLRAFGKVEVVTETVEASKRAREFKNYIAGVALA